MSAFIERIGPSVDGVVTKGGVYAIVSRSGTNMVTVVGDDGSALNSCLTEKMWKVVERYVAPTSQEEGKSVKDARRMWLERLRHDQHRGWFTKGKIYEVVGFDSSERPVIVGDDGNRHSAGVKHEGYWKQVPGPYGQRPQKNTLGPEDSCLGSKKDMSPKEFKELYEGNFQGSEAPDVSEGGIQIKEKIREPKTVTREDVDMMEADGGAVRKHKPVEPLRSTPPPLKVGRPYE